MSSGINPGGAWEEQSTGHGDQFGQGGEGRSRGQEIKYQISKIGVANSDGRMMRSALVMLRQLLVERSIDLEIWSSVETVRESIRTRSSYILKT